VRLATIDFHPWIYQKICLIENEKRQHTTLDTLLIMRGLLALSVVIWHFTLTNEHSPAFMSTPGRTAVWIFLEFQDM